jgi:hypothetical protein
MGIGIHGRVVVAALLSSVTVAYAATPSSLVRPLAGAEVDWSAGTVTASAGAAADMRMPSPDAARPGAERRARAAAIEKLRAALRALPVRGSERLGDKQVDAALSHADTTRIEYQSNGGVVLWVAVRLEELVKNASATPFGGFGTDSPPLLPPRASHAPVAATTTGPVVLAVGAMSLELTPLLAVGGQEIVARHVRYQQGPPPAHAISVRRDDKGRLVLSKGSEPTLDLLASGPVVIYLQKVLP